MKNSYDAHSCIGVEVGFVKSLIGQSAKSTNAGPNVYCVYNC